MAVPTDPQATRGTAKRIYIFDSPRTCSNLLHRLFAAHPQLTQLHHPLMLCTLYGPERILARFQHSERTERKQVELAAKLNMPDETYDVAVRRLQENVVGIEREGKIAYMKDHTISAFPPDLVMDVTRASSYSPSSLQNPTAFSDAFFNSLTPVFLIRHPAIMIPSWIRKADRDDSFAHGPLDEDCKALTSLRWTRLMFDACRARPGAGMPIVIDAADLVYSTKATMEALCRHLGIDPEGVQYSWPSVPEGQRPSDPILQVFVKELWDSSSVDRAAQPAEAKVDLVNLSNAWESEFGVKYAKAIRGFVEAEMPNYEYLKQYKVCA